MLDNNTKLIIIILVVIFILILIGGGLWCTNYNRIANVDISVDNSGKIDNLSHNLQILDRLWLEHAYVSQILAPHKLESYLRTYSGNANLLTGNYRALTGGDGKFLNAINKFNQSYLDYTVKYGVEDTIQVEQYLYKYGHKIIDYYSSASSAHKIGYTVMDAYISNLINFSQNKNNLSEDVIRNLVNSNLRLSSAIGYSIWGLQNV